MPNEKAIITPLSYDDDAVLTTNYLDDYIVQGKAFIVQEVFDVVADTPLYIYTSYANTKGEVFFIPPIVKSISGYVESEFFYNPTGVSGGTALSLVNKDFNSDKVTNISSISGVSLAGEGTPGNLRTLYGISAQGSFSGGGESAFAVTPFVINKNSTYLLKFVPSETSKIAVTAIFVETGL